MMNVAEWQKRLEDNFTVNGVIGGGLLKIIDQEQACGEYFVGTFHGQNVLIDSFQSFYIDTLENALVWVAKHGWPKGSENYAPILLYYVIMFRRFRACENLLLKGYPLDGYALLRDLKDRVILLAGIAHNITTFARISGLGGAQAPKYESREKVKKNRRTEQRRVLGKIIRKESGLPLDIIEELQKWEQLFHDEVHGSRLSFSTELLDWIRGTAALSIGPTPKESPTAMYMNRATEVGWLLVRLLPYLQPAENAFSVEWHRKHKILDDSFRYAQEGLSRLGKKIGNAFIKFIDEKFLFRKPFYYFEADGSGLDT